MYDTAIIGCGPAGLMASVYTARAQLSTVLFGDHTKSNLYKSHIIANYLGFPEPITGPDLTMRSLEQAKNFGTKHVIKEIVDLKMNDDKTFTLLDDSQQEYQAKTVIIATGQSYALSGIKNEKEFTGKGVSYCVTCDGFFFKNKKVVIVGSGNYAIEEAIHMLSYTKDVTIVSHGKEFKLSPEMEKLAKESNLNMQKTVRIKEIVGNGKAEVLLLSDGTEMAMDGVFMAIGVAGAISFAKKLGLELNGNYIKVDMEGKTNVPGLFAAGDCTGSPAQVASSVGGGCNAALSVVKLLRGLNIYIQYN